jgi:hypothetical protein
LRQLQIAVCIALVEGVVVGFFPGLTRWAVVALAVVAVLLYITLGRSVRWQSLHDVLWVLAFSQALAVIVAVLAFFSWVAFAVAAVLAIAVLVLLAIDR